MAWRKVTIVPSLHGVLLVFDLLLSELQEFDLWVDLFGLSWRSGFINSLFFVLLELLPSTHLELLDVSIIQKLRLIARLALERHRVDELLWPFNKKLIYMLPILETMSVG